MTELLKTLPGKRDKCKKTGGEQTRAVGVGQAGAFQPRSGNDVFRPMPTLAEKRQAAGQTMSAPPLESKATPVMKLA